MDPLELGPRRGRAGRQREQRIDEPGPLDPLVDRIEPGRPLGMTAPGVVEREHRVRGHEEHPRTVTQPGIDRASRLRLRVT